MITQIISSSRLLIILWLLTLLIAGAWVRVHGVNEYFYSTDELQHITISKGETVSEVAKFSALETHPPYPQILRHYLLAISDTPWFLRGESVVFGLLCILIYYAIGNMMGGPPAGCIAAWFIAFGYGSIIESQIVRNYSLLALLLGVAFYFYQAFLRTGKRSCLFGYAAGVLLALMAHYSAAFALVCMGGVGFIRLLWTKDRRSELCWWTAVNALLVFYFCCVYAMEIRHNAYEAVFLLNNKIATESPLYGTTGFRAALLVVYIPATVSYFLHSSFSNQQNILSIFLFLCAMTGIYAFSLGRALLWEALLALVLGAILLAANIYPYAFRIAGRHAMWELPYVILPVSLFLAYGARLLVARVPAGTVKKTTAAGMVIGVAMGFLINDTKVFFDDLREYELNNAQGQELDSFLASLTSEDIVISGSLNTMYLLPDGRSYYRALLATGGQLPYYSVARGEARIVYTHFYPPILQDKFASLRDLMTLMDASGELKHIRTVWFFNTIGASWNIDKCALPATRIIPFYHTGDGLMKGAGPIAEFIGIPYDSIKRNILQKASLCGASALQ